MHQTKATIHQALSPVKHLFDQDHPMGKIAKTPQEETTLELLTRWIIVGTVLLTGWATVDFLLNSESCVYLGRIDAVTELIGLMFLLVTELPLFNLPDSLPEVITTTLKSEAGFLYTIAGRFGFSVYLAILPFGFGGIFAKICGMLMVSATLFSVYLFYKHPTTRQHYKDLESSISDMPYQASVPLQSHFVQHGATPKTITLSGFSAKCPAMDKTFSKKANGYTSDPYIKIAHHTHGKKAVLIESRPQPKVVCPSDVEFPGVKLELDIKNPAGKTLGEMAGYKDFKIKVYDRDAGLMDFKDDLILDTDIPASAMTGIFQLHKRSESIEIKPTTEIGQFPVGKPTNGHPGINQGLMPDDVKLKVTLTATY